MKHFSPRTWSVGGKCAADTHCFPPGSPSSRRHTQQRLLTSPPPLPAGCKELSREDFRQCHLQLPPGCASVDNSVSDSLHHLLPEVRGRLHAAPAGRPGSLRSGPAAGDPVPRGLCQVKAHLRAAPQLLAFSSLCWHNCQPAPRVHFWTVLFSSLAQPCFTGSSLVNPSAQGVPLLICRSVSSAASMPPVKSLELPNQTLRKWEDKG